MDRPKCFDFAMDFLGEPESSILLEYIEALEKRILELEQELKEKANHEKV